MPYVNVWVDDADMLDSVADGDLIDELKHRGYIIFKKSEDPIFNIRQSYLLDSPEEFRVFVKKYLREKGIPI
jgi:uncharacterized protein (DUF2461 family)